MRQPRDITGERFGLLTAVRDVGSKPGCGRLWLCRCDCGGERIVPLGNLAREGSGSGVRSCGCRTRDGSLKRHPAYPTWRGMKARCGKLRFYEHVSLCEEWQDPKAFLEWADVSGFRPGLSIDRIDPRGNYEPGNCRWITLTEQTLNRRNTLKVEVGGKMIPLLEACKQTGINYHTAHSRLKTGRPPAEVLAEGCLEKRFSDRPSGHGS